MANPRELISWLLTNAGALKLKMDQLRWSDHLTSTFTDMRVEITIGNKSFYGFSGGAEPDLALVKASSEAIERAVSAENNFPTTNGFATHIDLNSAIRSATNELIERDAILCHFYGKVPYKIFQFENTKSQFQEDMHKWYVERGIKPLLFDLSEAGLLFVADGRHCKIRKFGFILGAGNRDSINESFEAAAIEASRQLAHILEANETNLDKPLDKFLKIEKPSFRDHGDLALNLEYASQIAFLFESTKNSRTNSLNPASISTTEIKSNLQELKGCPLVFAKAESPQAQSLFVGSPTPAKLNVERIRQFAGVDISESNLSPLPHPFN